MIAGKNDRTRDLLGRGSLDSALELSRRSLELAETPESILLHASVLSRLGRHKEVLSFAADKLADSTMVSRLLPLRRVVGMAAWALGNWEQARREFEILKETRISSAWAEDAALRLHCLGSEHPSALLPYFLGAVPDSSVIEFLRALRSRKELGDPTQRYLLGLALSRQAGFETLVAAGNQPEVAYIECLHELKLIVDLVYRGGLNYMRYSVSDTAEHGDYTGGPRVITDETRREMRRMLEEIRSGAYAEKWIAENQAGRPWFNARRREERSSKLEAVGERLRSMMPFLDPVRVTEDGEVVRVQTEAASVPAGSAR